MAMDQQQTFNWLVAEKSRLETELETWRERCFEIAFKAALWNPAIKAQIEAEKLAMQPSAEIMNFVLLG